MPFPLKTPTTIAQIGGKKELFIYLQRMCPSSGTTAAQRLYFPITSPSPNLPPAVQPRDPRHIPLIERLPKQRPTPAPSKPTPTSPGPPRPSSRIHRRPGRGVHPSPPGLPVCRRWWQGGQVRLAPGRSLLLPLPHNPSSRGGRSPRPSLAARFRSASSSSASSAGSHSKWGIGTCVGENSSRQP